MGCDFMVKSAEGSHWKAGVDAFILVIRRVVGVLDKVSVLRFCCHIE